MRDAVKKVARAVERVDDKARLALGASNLAAFFHQKAPIGTRDFEFPKNRIFGAFIGLRNEISRSLLRHLQMFDFAKIAAKLSTRFTGSFFHDGQKTG